MVAFGLNSFASNAQKQLSIVLKKIQSNFLRKVPQNLHILKLSFVLHYLRFNKIQQRSLFQKFQRSCQYRRYVCLSKMYEIAQNFYVKKFSKTAVYFSTVFCEQTRLHIFVFFSFCISLTMHYFFHYVKQ